MENLLIYSNDNIASYTYSFSFGTIYNTTNDSEPLGSFLVNPDIIKFWNNENLIGDFVAKSITDNDNSGVYWEDDPNNVIGYWKDHEVFDLNGSKIGRFDGPNQYGGVAAFFLLYLN